MLLKDTRVVKVLRAHAALGVRQLLVVRRRFDHGACNTFNVFHDFVELLLCDQLLGALLGRVRHNRLPVAVRALLKQLARARPGGPVAMRRFHWKARPVALVEARAVQFALAHGRFTVSQKNAVARGLQWNRAECAFMIPN